MLECKISRSEIEVNIEKSQECKANAVSHAYGVAATDSGVS